MRLQSIKQHLIFPLLALLFVSSPAIAERTANTSDLRVSPSSHPAAETVFVPPLDELPVIIPDASWYEQPGARKGVTGRVQLDEERFVAADIAVLDRGFAASWPVLLAEHRQPAVLVGPNGIAGLQRTKQLLIIPSGALSNTSESAFFRAGLAEFVRSGGVILCMAQRTGIDFSSLPVPEGQRLVAAGWDEEDGPLFRSSTIRSPHLFENIAGPSPAMETDGYFTLYPANGHVLLSRTDGFPTVIAYPFEKGWIIATTLFTDFSLLLGYAEPDEKTFVRNLLAWSGNPADFGKRPPAASMQSEAAVAAVRDRQSKPPSSPLLIRSRAERKESVVRLSLEMPVPPKQAGRAVLVRSEGMEKTVMLAEGMLPVSLELPAVSKRRRISYAVYETNGRAIARGSVVVPAEQSGIMMERPSYFPGDTAVIHVKGMGKGEIMAGGFGFLDNEIISDRGSMNLTVPDRLPAGVFRIHWNFREIRGNETQGDLYVDVAGYRLDIHDVALERKSGNTATASFTIHADTAVSGKLSVMLKSPDGSASIAAERVVSLIGGLQSIPVSFPFSADQGGIWELSYSFRTALPAGPGIPAGPVDLASGSMLFDAGHSAVLAVYTDKPLYYEPAGPVEVRAVLAGNEPTDVEVHLDGKQVVRGKIDLSGTMQYRASLPPPGPGFHTVRISLTPNSSAGCSFTYGLNLPDLSVKINPGEPGADANGPVMPFIIQVRNEGKSRARSSRIAFFEQDRPQAPVMRVEVPALDPAEQQEIAVSWPLYGKAGSRTLTVAVDPENDMTESDRRNNSASSEIIVPEIMLFSAPENTSFKSGDPISLGLMGFNLASHSRTGLILDTRIKDRGGRIVFSEASPVPEIVPERENRIFALAKLNPSSIGTFVASARLLKEQRQLASVSTSFNIEPTLLLRGSFADTPDTAIACRPFTVRARIMNTGNIAPTSGTIVFAISPAKGGKPLYSKTIPYSPGLKNFVIDCLDLPAGPHIIRMTASVANKDHAISRELVLAEQKLELRGPVDVVRINGSFPRVLLWLGRGSRVVEQAVSESIVKQAFALDNMHYRIVDTEDDFIAQAMTGIFNTYVLFEPWELPDAALLGKLIENGRGLAIIGSGDNALALAETFGFSFDKISSNRPPSMARFVDGEIGLSGSMPVSGKALLPLKRGAKPVAFYSPSGDPAALLDEARKGKILVLPLSLSRSAYHGGTPALFSLALRKLVLSVSPKTDAPGGAASMGFAVSSAEGPVKAMITGTFNPADRVLWTNAGGTIRQNSVSHTLTADKDPQYILYIYQPAKSQSKNSVEIFYEFNGTFRSQGKIE